jgi:hypothetical protein
MDQTATTTAGIVVGVLCLLVIMVSAAGNIYRRARNARKPARSDPELANSNYELATLSPATTTTSQSRNPFAAPIRPARAATRKYQPPPPPYAHADQPYPYPEPQYVPARTYWAQSEQTLSTLTSEARSSPKGQSATTLASPASPMGQSATTLASREQEAPSNASSEASTAGGRFWRRVQEKTGVKRPESLLVTPVKVRFPLDG